MRSAGKSLAGRFCFLETFMDIMVENGTGIVTANAYASVEEVDNILSVNIHSKWSLITDEDTKGNLIIWASRIIDERVRWHGHKTHPTSGLAWPRIRVRDKENILIDDNVVPKPVKIAVAILADQLLVSNPEAVNTANNLSMLTVDVITLKFDPNIIANKYTTELYFVLSGLGYLSFGRGGPKRIIKH